MDLVLRRCQALCSMFNKCQLKPWHRKHFKQNSNFNPRTLYFTSATGSAKKGNQTMSQNTDLEQLIRNFNSVCNVALKFRHWQALPTQGSTNGIQSNRVIFKLVSYNILAQNLLVEHLRLYRYCNQMFLKWSYRLKKLTEEILSQRPDILCLQEVQSDHLSELVSIIKSKLSMTCVFKKKTGFRSDGCAIFYNNFLFDLVSVEVVEYYQPGFQQFLDRPQIAVMAKLRCKSPPNITFLVCTTHLLFNPRREDVRLAQLIVLLAELDRHSMVTTADGKLQRLPIILTGDFNFTPDTAPFELITSGKLCYEELSRNTLSKLSVSGSPPMGKQFLSHRLGITDSCQHIDCVQSNYKELKSRLYASDNRREENENQPAPPVKDDMFSTGTLTHSLNLKSVYDHSSQSLGSTYQNRWITVDHIFSSETDQALLKPLAVYQLPTIEDCQRISHLPNAHIGSDHLMLSSLFSLG